jgi:hypothetical protein
MERSTGIANQQLRKVILDSVNGYDSFNNLVLQFFAKDLNCHMPARNR